MGVHLDPIASPGPEMGPDDDRPLGHLLDAIRLDSDVLEGGEQVLAPSLRDLLPAAIDAAIGRLRVRPVGDRVGREVLDQPLQVAAPIAATAARTTARSSTAQAPIAASASAAARSPELIAPSM